MTFGESNSTRLRRFVLLVERLIVDACGEDIAGRLHTARSRNDIDMTMYRMRQRELVLELLAATFELRRSLLDLVSRHGRAGKLLIDYLL